MAYAALVTIRYFVGELCCGHSWRSTTSDRPSSRRWFAGDVGGSLWHRITAGSVGEFRKRPVTLEEFAAAKVQLNRRYTEREARRHAAA